MLRTKTGFTHMSVCYKEQKQTNKKFEKIAMKLE